MNRKNALILGVSSGFGKSTALELAKRGYNIYGAHLDLGSAKIKAEELRKEIEELGVEAIFFNTNVADADNRQNLITEIRNIFVQKGNSEKLGVFLHSIAFGALGPFIDENRELQITQKKLEMSVNVMANSLLYWVQDLFHANLFTKHSRVLAMTSNGTRVATNKYGYTYDNEPVYAKSLNVINAMTALLKEVLNPNLVQTTEATPCIVHLGPFANIAHGCNSVIATKMGLKLSDYCITEAGFGADLGAEKFLDIKTRKSGLVPDLVVLVATIKALKYNGGCSEEKLSYESIEFLEKGIENLGRHIENLAKFKLPVVVSINKFDSDTDKEIEYVKSYCKKLNAECEISTAFADGSEGSIKLADLVVKKIEETSNKNFEYIYNDNDSIKEKIEKICKNIYGAKEVTYSDKALTEIESANILGYNNLPICFAKTPLSLSDDPKLLGAPKNFEIHVRDIKIASGAGFIIAYAGEIMTMPGLGKKAKYEEFK